MTCSTLFLKVLEDCPGDLSFWYCHISKGAWPFSTRDHGWPISDCTAEGLKASLLLSQIPSKTVGEPIDANRLYDAVNVILSLQEFGCQEDMMFCGVFDGHGPWGHYVAKRVRESLPSSLLCNWQETLAMSSITSEFLLESDKMLNRFDIWKESYLRTY
ncbi:lupeol synthase 1-like [Magnolia sinica]|uniref:lupeol synthase 1-like n=1 Tax=Magnolia sinica TaxID=86752 RepID=UPI0026586A29|nr:lupeol synthase 1-like [Magnolia sinica]